MADVSVLIDESALAPEPVRGFEPIRAEDVSRIVPERAPPPPPPLGYRVALASVAATALVLALVYAALVAAVLWALWWHFTTNSIVADGLRKAREYVGLAIVLLVFLAMMLRPLLARRREETTAVTVTRDDEPVLHAFVERLARAVDAPVPARIDVDTDVNASAGFRRGLASFRGDDLVLTIGAPLLAGASVEEFANVLAHELGHFRQGAGMRLAYVARTLEGWFLRVAFQRDRWDEELGKFGLIVGPIQLWAWLMRKLFQAMHSTIRRVERLASRRMEFDADSHALALVGGPPTVAMLRKLVLLDAASELAHASAQKAFEGGRLPDDLPSLVVGWRARIAPDAARAVLTQALDAKTDSRASHPCVRERAERAASVPAGPMRCDRPARALLRDPEALFREVTARRFAAIAQGMRFVPAGEILDGEDRRAEAEQAFERWTHGAVSYLVLPRIADWVAEPPPPADRAADELRRARDDLAARAPACIAALRMFDAADTRIVEARRVEAVAGVDGAVHKMENVTTIDDRSVAGAASALASAPAAQRAARKSIDPALEALGRRFRAGLVLLGSTDAAAAVEALASRLAAIEGALADVDELRTRLPAAQDLVRERDVLKNRRAGSAIGEMAVAFRADVERISARLANASEVVSLPPDDATSDAVFDAARAAVAAVYRAWFDTAQDLALALEGAEQAAGFASPRR